MTSGTIDDSQRKAARVWGFTYLFALANVMFVNFGIHDRFIVAGKAAETARNIWRTNNCFVSASPAICFTASALSSRSQLFT